jgi:hypothetical protein
MGNSAEFEQNLIIWLYAMDHFLGFGSALQVIAQDLVLHYVPYHQTNNHRTGRYQYFFKA